MRAVQLLPATRYTAAEKGDRLALGAHAEHSLALQVHAGATLEVTLAQVRSNGWITGLLNDCNFVTFPWKGESSFLHPGPIIGSRPAGMIALAAHSLVMLPRSLWGSVCGSCGAAWGRAC